ncbi:putative chlorogenic acid esterase precursor [Rosellinia necatrix]|uniref:Carboxylic ester hydrolase n=1 Tax=Rosellinia necatrix TaxID=77044 RepID=A0A1W2TI92_ROSNE|nr:putative chlorogenic acid esterase precursor [Rosellinia necatrix]
MPSITSIALQALLATGAVAGRKNRCNGSDHSVTVNTTSGLFAPYVDGAFPSVASFPDIPYAQDPTGPLRFAPPVAALPRSSDVTYATRLPLGCFQYTQEAFRGTVSFYSEKSSLFQRGDTANTTEDCLRLSIFAPKATVEHAAFDTSNASRGDGGNLPVIVWIHGGGFSFGGTNVPYQLSPSWVERSQAHIVVQVQYRLNLLGQPNAAGLTTPHSSSGQNENLNFGLLDQRLAVEWVRDNIASFGGDPERITLWGHSAGAYNTDGYLFAWPEDPIIQGVIANSGNAIAIPAFLSDATNHSTFSTAAQRLGCGGLGPVGELSCMRAVPASDIKSYIQGPAGAVSAATDALAFGTIIDNVTFFADYPGRIAANDPSLYASQIPLLISTTTDEGNAVVPYEFGGSDTATELPPALAGIAAGFTLNLRCTTLQDIGLRASVGATTYRFLYGGNFSDISPVPWLGAYHGAELPMVFGTHGLEGPSGAFERQVSHRMQDLYLEFARDPAEGLKRAGWPEATTGLDDPTIMEFAVGGVLDQLVSPNQRNLAQGCA